MNIPKKQYPAIAFFAALLISFIAGTWLVSGGWHTLTASGHDHDEPHPIGYADSGDEVHVHSDWLVHIDGTTLDFSAERYQTNALQKLSEHIHLHDNNGLTIHRHAEAITLAEFFASLGFTFTDECITTDQDTEYCSDTSNSLLVFVNNEVIENPSSYVNQEKDQILVYFGDPNATAVITELQNTVSDTACIYSGTCPERGTPPPESCGITCEF